MKYFIKANDPELGKATYIFDNIDDMRMAWNKLGDNVMLVYMSKAGVKSVLFERCW